MCLEFKPENRRAKRESNQDLRNEYKNHAMNDGSIVGTFLCHSLPPLAQTVWFLTGRALLTFAVEFMKFVTGIHRSGPAKEREKASLNGTSRARLRRTTGVLWSGIVADGSGKG